MARNPDRHASPAAEPGAVFWRRPVAFGIDAALLVLLGFLLGEAFRHPLAELGAWGRAAGFGLTCLYFVPGNSRWCGGQTPGKKLLGIRVVDGDGGCVPAGRSLLRCAVLWLPVFVLNKTLLPAGIFLTTAGTFGVLIAAGAALCILYLFLFNTATRQSLHDLAAGTHVVDNFEAGTPGLFLPRRGHYAAVGGLMLLASMMPLAASGVWDHVPCRSLELAEGRIRSMSHVTGTKIVAGAGIDGRWQAPGETAGWISARIYLDEPVADWKGLARDLSRIIVKNGPAGSPGDEVEIVLLHGFDIGIAFSVQSHGFRFTPADLFPDPESALKRG
jgi:uncharacterized RDD family membrane protein YckC